MTPTTTTALPNAPADLAHPLGARGAIKASLAASALALNATRSEAATLTTAQAARLLAQASMGGNSADIARVQTLGVADWINDQFALPRQVVLYNWLLDKGFLANGKTAVAGIDHALWRSLIGCPDTLRQRVAFALSEILVINYTQSAPWRNFAAAAWMDLLLDNAFGNFRTLLEKVSTNVMMGRYLTFINNRKADPTKGSLPDENYAREILQLFTIGLYQLNTDGTQKLASGKPIETYGQADVMGLARVFTGWRQNGNNDTPDAVRAPMIMYAPWHETGAKTFLGATIPAGTDGVASLRRALDVIFAHPNVGPFIGKQLIQRLVTSNPSPAYVARVAQTFNNNGSGVRGDMKAVIRAILLDTEARTLSTSTTAGKVREPILRFTQWARAFNAVSPTDQWDIPATDDPAIRLAQSPLRAPSVFNFFRPGYVPANTSLSQKNLVAPEMQITEEVSVAGYINFMQGVARNGLADLKADYSDLLPLAGDATALANQVNLVLAAGQLSAATVGTIATAVATISAATATGKQIRIQAVVLLTLASPEFIVLK